MMKFDVIIPVAFKDYFFLERTIPYIIKNINPSSIFIITNIVFRSVEQPKTIRNIQT